LSLVKTTSVLWSRPVRCNAAGAVAHLAEHGWQPDCVVLRRQHDLGAAQEGQLLVALAAAKLGQKVRGGGG
jgi:pantoate--beta-alanine ligase